MLCFTYDVKLFLCNVSDALSFVIFTQEIFKITLINWGRVMQLRETNSYRLFVLFDKTKSIAQASQV